MRRWKATVLGISSFLILAIGGLLAFGWQDAIVIAKEENAIETLIHALQDGKDVSRQELIPLLKLYSKEIASGRKVISRLVENGAFAGKCLILVAILQMGLLLVIRHSLREARRE